MNTTPKSNRLHIGIFGPTNAGKSTLLNIMTNQEISLVSNISGTTTDPVYKAMELFEIGPVVFIDTAGFNDDSALGKEREKKTKEVIEKIDIGLIVIREDNLDEKWLNKLKEKNKPLLAVFNNYENKELEKNLKEKYNIESIKFDKEKLRLKIKELTKEVDREIELVTRLVKKDDLVLLVMPQDIQAPKGRLILPQVQTIRNLLDNKCIVVSTTKDQYLKSLTMLKKDPDLIITDSQIFKYVYENKPEKSLLTSFSVLFAAAKGDIFEFVKGASAIDSLNENSKILIAEACTHAPLEEDIGRVKIPKLLRNKFGDMEIIHVSGNDFPEDLSKYDLVILCGSCMFNRSHVMNRINRAKNTNTPITNYGITIAHLNNILDKVVY